MMRSSALLVLLLIVTGAFQVSLGPRLCIYGVQPDPLLVCVIVAGLLHGPQVGAVTGFLAGWFTFALQGALPGSFLISRMVTGYLSGFLEHRLFKENPYIYIGGAFLGTLVAHGLLLLIYPDWIRQVGWQKQALYGALYNAALAPWISWTFNRAHLDFGES